jgi:glycopeptide antibiotics resistance protein
VYVSQGAWKFTYLFVGNIIWFVPYGFMLPLLNGKLQFLLVAIYGLFLTILVEFTQFVTKRGVFELDDLILNTVGVIIGYGVYHITIGNKHRGKSK